MNRNTNNMPVDRNSHGGRRANSGWRHTSQTLGPPDRQGGLHRFFGGNFGGRQTQDNTEDAEHVAVNALVPVANNQDRILQELTPEILPNYGAHDDGFDEQLAHRGKY